MNTRKRLDDRVSDQRQGLSRRTILRGTAGIALTLPLLESFVPRAARAEQSEGPHPLLLCHQGNGVAQGDRGGEAEPDLWWPTATGALTSAGLEAESGQAVSELSEYADRMLLVGGIDARYPGGYDSHTGAATFCFTGARLNGSDSLRPQAGNESIDTYVANQLTPGSPPLHLQVGGPNWNHTSISWAGAGQANPIDKNPNNIYLRLFADRMFDDSTDRVALENLARAKTSVIDHVREELLALRSMNLSRADNDNLQLHLDSIRDFEVRAATETCTSPDGDVVTRLGNISNDDASRDEMRDEVVDLHARLIALGFACDDFRAVALRFGNIADGTYYVLPDGSQVPYNYHSVSHRKDNQGGGDGSDIGNGLELHHQIDRTILRHFGIFLRHIGERTAANGNSLLDESTCVLMSSLGYGRVHSESNLPFCIVGSGGGFFKQGQYINLRSSNELRDKMNGDGGVSHNRMLNTLINAAGVRKSDGSLVDDFGTGPMNEGGVIADLLT